MIMFDYWHAQLGLINAGRPFNLNGIQYPANWLTLATPTERSTHGFKLVQNDVKPDDETYNVSGPVIDSSGPIVQVTYTSTPRPLAALKKHKLEKLRQKRKTVERGGTEPTPGQIILTDVDDQAKITGAWALAQQNPAVIMNWKAASGWVQLNAAAINSIALAVATHVQTCFNNERTHADAINALSTPAAVLAYDFSTGWPANPQVNP